MIQWSDLLDEMTAELFRRIEAALTDGNLP